MRKKSGIVLSHFKLVHAHREMKELMLFLGIL